MPDIWKLDKIKLGHEAKQVSGLLLELRDDQRAALRRSGVWWVLPLARRGQAPLGVRLMPELPLEKSPIVTVYDAEVVTASSEPRYLVPVLMIGAAAGIKWAQVTSLPEAAWTELNALHRALGGSDGLKPLRKLIAEDEKLNVWKGSYPDNVDPSKTIAKLYCKADPAPGNEVFRKYAFEALKRHTAPLPLPDTGCFSAAVAGNAFLCNKDAKRKDEEAQAAWALLQHPAGLDPVSLSASPRMIITSTSDAHETLISAAKSVVKYKGKSAAAWKADPLWPAVDKLARAGAKYDGVTHLEAAAMLEKAKAPERALWAYAAAGFWSYIAREEANPEAFKGARGLAARVGWKHIAAAFEQIAGSA